MSFNHDYQNSMTPDAKYLDQEGEKAADKTTVTSAPTHEQAVITQHDGGTYRRDEGVMGMLPAQPLPLEFAISKQAEFRKMAEETDTARSTPTGSRSAGSGAAFNSQMRMVNNYGDDVHRLEDSQREFDMFAPLGNLAKQSYEKMKLVGTTIGIDQGFRLDATQTAALGPAGRTKDNTARLHDGAGNSVKDAAHRVSISRKTLLSAGQAVAAVVEQEVLRQLQNDISKATKEKQEIEEKIEKVAHIVGYLETAGSIVAGGAGLAAAAAPGAAAVAETEDVKLEIYEKTKGVGEKVEKGGGMLESAVKVGMGLYYNDKLREIEGKINVAVGMLAPTQQEIVAKKTSAAYNAFDAASEAYATDITAYQNAVTNRREAMAAVGAAADHSLDPKGGDPMASQAMVWTSAAMETQSFLDSAMAAGAQAQRTVDGAESSIVKHREAAWGTLEDAATESNTPRKEGLGGPDVSAIKSMTHLVDWWMQGANNVKTEVDEAVEKKASHVLKDIGYTGDY